MPCANPNLKRELSAITKQAKRQGLWKIGRKNGKRSGGGKSKFGLKDLVRTVDLEMPGKNVYKKLITDAAAGKTEGFYPFPAAYVLRPALSRISLSANLLIRRGGDTRELFRTMKDIDYGNIKSWHMMFDGYSPPDDETRKQFRTFIMTDPIVKRVLA
tara:strand:- start:1845 stop:2318 length:474 start_codon:yes stop_codon:yes gene_type:complete